MSNFVESHKEDIALLNTKVADAIDSLKIDTSGPLSIAKCIKVTGEINKAIKNVKSLYKAISSVPAEDKAGILLSVTIATINSDEVKAKGLVEGVSAGCFPQLYEALGSNPPDQVITL